MGAFLKKDQKTKLTWRSLLPFSPRLEERKNQILQLSNLSGGEQQMLFNGSIALMSTPKLLLLDEPSMGLAPIFIKKSWYHQDIKQGTTVLLIESKMPTRLLPSQTAVMFWKQGSRSYWNRKELLASKKSAKNTLVDRIFTRSLFERKS